MRVCKVESDVGELQIVCGAPNARAGIKVALAKEGAVISPHVAVWLSRKPKSAALRATACWRAPPKNWVWAVTATASLNCRKIPKIGESIVGVLGLDDPVIEIAITPNRADCLGVHGVARDLPPPQGLGH